MDTKTSTNACPECSQAISPNRVFCSSDCKRVWNNRLLKEGGSLMLLAKAWRQGRNKKNGVSKNAFTEFCLAVDRSNAEDRAAGRMKAIDVLENRYRRMGLRPDSWVT